MIMPIRSASIPSTVSPLNSSSLVFSIPILIGHMPIVGGIPIARPAGWPNRAVSDANTMSQAPIISPPPARHQLCTWAMIGLRYDHIQSQRSTLVRRPSRSSEMRDSPSSQA